MNKYYLIMLFALFGCDLVVHVDVPFEHQQLTVNAFANPDSVWRTTVALNRFILDDQPFKRIENATVTIYSEGNQVATLTHVKNGVYRASTEKPEAGKTYEIRVEAEGYESVSAQTNIPAPAQITSAELTSVLDGPDTKVSIRLKFNDDPGEKNYYLITMLAEYETLDPSSSTPRTYRQSIYVHSTDPTIQSENIATDIGVYLKDVFFNGKEADLLLKTDNNQALFAGSVILVLETLNKDYYDYKTTMLLQLNTSDNPFAQPVNVISNINGGFGVFGGSSHTTFIKTHPKPVITEIVPARGKVGDHIIIRGHNLRGQNYGYVEFIGERNGRPSIEYARSISATDTEMEVIVPQFAKTGKIFVSSNGRIGTSDIEFEVIE